jgi:2-keto-4-pentenoate hydratase
VIEACGSRCALAGVPAGGSTFQRVADGGIGSHVVLGPTMNAAAAKAAKLSDVQIELSVNGEVKVNGAGSAVFGDPVRFPGRFQCVFCVSFRVIYHHVSCLTSSAPIS